MTSHMYSQHAMPVVSGEPEQQQHPCKLPQRSPLSVLDALAYEHGSPYASASEAGASPFPVVSPEPAVPLTHGRENMQPAAPALPVEPANRPDVSEAVALPAVPLRPKCTTPPKKSVTRRFFDCEPAPSQFPLTPGSGRTRHRTRVPRAGDMVRKNSLNDNKVLMATTLKRTESVVSPALFQFSGHFEFLSLLGSSKHSEVYKVRHRQTGELFAVKRCRRKLETRSDRERCMREIMAVSALPGHPNIVGQYRAWQQEGHFYIQMDVCEGGSLATLSQEYIMSGQSMPEELLWQVLSDTAQGLAFLHANGVLHLDVKPDNLYLDNVGTFKIGDFGLAWLREQWDWEEGDGRYVAPELLLSGDREPSSAADVYSLGAALYECATGHLLPRSACERDAGSVLLPNRSSPFQWLLQQMLHPDPTQRPLAATLVQQVAALHGPVCLSPTLARAFDPPLADTATPPLAPSSSAAAPEGPSCSGWGEGMVSPFSALGPAPDTAASLEDWANEVPAAGPTTQGGVGAAMLPMAPSFGNCSFTSRVASMMSLGSSRSNSMADMPGWSDSDTDGGSGAAGRGSGGLALSFGQRLDAVAGVGCDRSFDSNEDERPSQSGGFGDFDDEGLPAVQPSETPQCFGKRASRRSLGVLPPRAPSFSFDRLDSFGDAGPSCPVDIPVPTPGTRLARDMSMVSLADHCPDDDDDDDSCSDADPVAPMRLFSMGGGGGDSLSASPSF